jgi:hypothetical protein
MDMRVMEEVLPPGVQHRGHADRGPEMLGIGGDCLHSLGRRPKQDIVDDRLVLQRDAGDRGRHGEHDVEVGNRQQLALAIGEPLGAGETLALRTVPVAAGIVGNGGLTAILAAFDMAAERRCPAHLARRHDAALSESQAAGLVVAIDGTIAAEDIRHLERRSHTRRSARRHHHQAEAIERARCVGDQRGRDLRIAVVNSRAWPSST